MVSLASKSKEVRSELTVLKKGEKLVVGEDAFEVNS